MTKFSGFLNTNPYMEDCRKEYPSLNVKTKSNNFKEKCESSFIPKIIVTSQHMPNPTTPKVYLKKRNHLKTKTAKE